MKRLIHLLCVALLLLIAIAVNIGRVAAVTVPQVVSVNSNGDLANNASFIPGISKDGRYVAFTSTATNLSSEFTQQQNPNTPIYQVYLRDNLSGETKIISSRSGVAANSYSSYLTMSPNGRFIAYYTDATNLGEPNFGSYQCHIYDNQINDTIDLNVPFGITANSCAGISNDGRYVLIFNQGTTGNFEGLCGVNYCFWDQSYYLFDRINNYVTPVAIDDNGKYGQVGSNGNFANYRSASAAMSSDGSKTLFTTTSPVKSGLSDGYHTFLRNMNTNEIKEVLPPANYYIQPADLSITPDGKTVIYRAISLVDSLTHIFSQDTTTGVNIQIDVRPDGNQSNGYSDSPTISDDGKLISFRSVSTDLTADGSTTGEHSFVRNTQTNTTYQIDFNRACPNGMPCESTDIHMANDGTTVFTDYDASYSPQIYLSLPPSHAPDSPVLQNSNSPSQKPTLSWSAVVDATSYNVYRDSTVISNTNSTTYIDTSANDGSHSYYVTAVNSSGESVLSNSVNVLVDKTDPTITYIVSPSPNINSWNLGDTTVTFNCSDSSSGIANCSSPATLTDEGRNQVATGTATDSAGNTASVTATVNIDKTTPTITANVSPAPNSDGWNDSDTTVSFTCSDGLSGIATCPSPINLSEGAGQIITGTATDKAGNMASATVMVNVDKTAPVVNNLSWSANPIQQGQSTTLMANVTDGLSGVKSVSYTLNDGSPQSMTYDPISGQWIATFGSSLAVNTYNVVVTATDTADNNSAGKTDVLAVYTTANGYVTGHAKMSPSATDTMPIALDTSNHPAQLVLGFTNVTAPTSGSFDMDYSIKNNQNEFSLSSASINWVVVQDSTHASILGHADMTKYVNGVKTVTINMAVRFDITLGTGNNPSHVNIKLFNPGDDPNTAAPAYVISDDVDANGSNLIIHP